MALDSVGWGLMVGIPLLAIVFSEAIERLKRRKIPLAQALRSFRNVTLPLLAGVRIWRYIPTLETDTLPFRLVQTALWLSLLLNGLLLLTTLFTPRSRPVAGKIGIPSLYLLGGRICIVLVCAIYILSNIWRIDLVQITSALGVGSLVIALALQDTLSNLVSGFLLLLDRPFDEGDWLRVGEIEAEVLEMNWRSVRLRDRNRDIIVIPNGELGKATIRNYTLLDKNHSERVAIGFSYDDSPSLVKQVLLKAVAATAGVIDPPAPKIRIKNYGAYCVDYEVKFFLNDYRAKDDICSELRSHIYYISRRNGLAVPYPISMEYQIDEEKLEGQDSHEVILEVLKTLPYFAAIAPERLSKLAHAASLETYGSGEVIVEAGRFDPGLFVIRQGRVALTLMDKDHQEQNVTELEAGDFFGERVLLRVEPSLVTVKVIDDLVAIRLPPRAVASLAERNLRFARDINQLLEERAKEVHLATHTQKTDQSYPNQLFVN